MPSDPSGPTFAMIGCANGAETAVKREIAAQGWRLAFSRPGFVTAKHDDDTRLPGGIFIRTASRSLGSAKADVSGDLIAKLIASLDETSGQRFDQLHVWPRDRLPIGKYDFEPSIDELSQAVAAEIFSAVESEHLRCHSPNQIANEDDLVLDVVIVEPNQWFWGTHTAMSWPTRWPGAIQPINPADEPVSRAYYKAAEAITWSGFELREGDVAIEIGSAPGGACGRLLELGLKVIGIDPAEMDPRIAEHENYHHITARAGDLKRREYRGAKWLLVDSNVKPDQTLTTVQNIVTHDASSFHGLLLTLKLGDYGEVESLERWTKRIESWNPVSVQARQLARNKREICFAVRMN